MSKVNSIRSESRFTPLFHAIAADERIEQFLTLADEHMSAIGYTEHGKRHALHVAKEAALILSALSYHESKVELASIAGYLHDVGNFVCRTNHGQTAAILLYPILLDYISDPRSIGIVLSAIGNHEEEYGQVYNPVCAAVMIADKADVHRSRVRAYDPAASDIHDQVNYAVTSSHLSVDAANREICLVLELDDAIATVMDYFEIFMERMRMCKSAAEHLGCSFHIRDNGNVLT